MSAPASPAEPRTLPHWGPLALVLFAVATLGANLGGARVLTYHEAVITQPAREMVATGDWLVPTFGGVVFPDKPPLATWLVAASGLLFGGFDAAVARFPAVLAAAVTAVLVATLGARLCGRAVGLVAGLVQLTSYGTLMQGRLAEPDMPLTACVTAAMTCFAVGFVLRRPDDERSRPWIKAAFLTACGLAFLAKGPIALAFVGGGIGLYVVLARRWSAAAFLLSPLGWAMFLLATVGWPAAAYLERPEILDGWIVHNTGRFNGTLGNESNPFYYATALPLLLLPWLPFTVGGTALLAKRFRDETDDRRGAWLFLACWFAFGAALLQAAAFKHKHYLLPLLPPLSLLTATGLTAWARVTWPSWRVPVAFGAATCLGVTLAGVLVERARPGLGFDLAPTLAVLAAGVTAAYAASRFGAWRTHLGFAFATAAAVAALVQTRTLPRFDSYRDQAEFARRVDRLVPDDASIAVVGLPESQVMLYLPVDSPRVDDPEAFRAMLSGLPEGDGGEAFSVMPRRLAERFVIEAGGRVLDRCDSVRRQEHEADRLTLVGFSTTGRTADTLTVGAIAPAGPLRIVDAALPSAGHAIR